MDIFKYVVYDIFKYVLVLVRLEVIGNSLGFEKNIQLLYNKHVK